MPSKSFDEIITLAFFERQPERLQVPAVLPVPRRGQLAESIADLVRRQISQRQDQLAANARIGVVGHREQDIEMLERGRRLLGIGVLVFDATVLAAIAAQNANGLLTEPRFPLVDRRR